MASQDRVNLPFRWSFVPEQNPRDGSIRWTWRALTQAGEVAMKSEGAFETFTDCMNDAKAHGYGER
jgi:hypothetical protein